MTVLEKQFIQCFQMTVDDLKKMIEESVKSVISSDLLSKDSSKTFKLVDTYSKNDLLTRDQVMTILDVSPPTLWRYNKSGTLKYKYKTSKRVYYDKNDVYDYLENCSL